MASPGELHTGLRHEANLTVDGGLTVPGISTAFGAFANMPPVFATAYLVGFVEATCIETLAPFLDSHLRTVGTHVDLSHCGATPVGMRVTAHVELIAIEGRTLTFAVECRDEVEVICAGLHRRVIVDAAKFSNRAEAKSTRAPVEQDG